MSSTRQKIFWILILSCFFNFRAEAQESVNGGWSVPETKQEVSRPVSIAITANGQSYIKLAPSAFDGKALKSENNADGKPTFPVSIPVKIIYPRKAIRKGWEGQAVIAAEILPGGTVGRMALAKSSGHEVLDHAAQEAIKTWKFDDESENEDAVPQYVDIPVTFKLEDR